MTDYPKTEKVDLKNLDKNGIMYDFGDFNIHVREISGVTVVSIYGGYKETVLVSVNSMIAVRNYQKGKIIQEGN